MTDKEIIKALECCASESIEDCQVCPYMFDTIYCEQMKLRADALDLINRQQEQLEAAVAGQETLQKALADKDREVAELNSDLKLLKNDYDNLKTNFDETVEKNKRLRDKVVGLTAEKEIERLKKLLEEEEAKYKECAKRFYKEAIKEFAERLKEALPMECITVVEGNDMEGITDTGFQKDDTMTTIDNLVKEMIGE